MGGLRELSGAFMCLPRKAPSHSCGPDASDLVVLASPLCATRRATRAVRFVPIADIENLSCLLSLAPRLIYLSPASPIAPDRGRVAYTHSVLIPLANVGIALWA
jgi:hypothetical protein